MNLMLFSDLSWYKKVSGFIKIRFALFHIPFGKDRVKSTSVAGQMVLRGDKNPQYGTRGFDVHWPPGLGLNPKNTWSAMGLVGIVGWPRSPETHGLSKKKKTE